MDQTYEDILFCKLVLSFSKNFEATKGECVVIGLSGGIDSAVAAAVAVKAVGVKNIKPYFMPYKTSSIESLKDAELFCDVFGLSLEVIDITPVADAFFLIAGNVDDVRKGNAMARLRMTMLFDKAKEHSGIVAGTSNRSEMLLGYSTWHGDSASSINILGSLYKNEVVKIAKSVGVPESIITKPPTADLWPGQTDESDMGFTYDNLDKFFFSVIELGMDREAVYELFGADNAKKIASRVLCNSFKRKMPVICEAYDCGKPQVIVDEIFRKLI